MVLSECGCLIVASEHRELCLALEIKQDDLLNWIMKFMVIYQAFYLALEKIPDILLCLSLESQDFNRREAKKYKRP